MNYLRRLRKNFTLHEISGSLGDLGTLLPIMMSLAVAGQINLTSTLWFTGIWNIVSGLIFQVPVCVQPMKAIAAVVLTKHMSMQENMAAGITVGAILFVLGATRTIHLIGAFTPTPVIKGLQLGTAVQLMIKAHNLIPKLQWTIDSNNWADNNTWVLLAFIFVVACYRTRIPSALILFLIGLIFSLVLMFATEAGSQLPRPSVAGGHYPDTVIIPNTQEFRTGFLNAGLGQIPLTSLNSVIALCALIDDLFPKKHATTSSVAVSVGIMNLIGCWFGAMPLCHGSGGLAGQYRFGARSEVSVIFLGSCKLLLGILFGSSLVGLLQVFPTSLLAVMLFISGVELGSAARSVNDSVKEDALKRENYTIMLLTMGTLVAYSNDGIGFVSGLVSAALLSMQRLGLSTWFKHTVQEFKSVPQQWRDQGIKVPLSLPITAVNETIVTSQQEETVLVSDMNKPPLYDTQMKPSVTTTESSSSVNK